MSTASKRAFPRERKTARLELRVAPSVRALIEQATAISGLAAGDLAYQAARQVLAEHDRLELRGADRDAFLAAVSSPPRPRARLVAALRLHEKLRR
jgi:uncharacterized protein (DUF1778 family)